MVHRRPFQLNSTLPRQYNLANSAAESTARPVLQILPLWSGRLTPTVLHVQYRRQVSIVRAQKGNFEVFENDSPSFAPALVQDRSVPLRLTGGAPLMSSADTEVSGSEGGSITIDGPGGETESYAVGPAQRSLVKVVVE